MDGSSRRTSWSSDGRDSRIYGVNPFDDSRAPSRAGSDDENVNTQTVSEKYNILPSAGLLLFPEDVEKDDWLHNPDPNEKEKRECDIFSRRGLVNLGGLGLLTLGILILFIGYPVLYGFPSSVQHNQPEFTFPKRKQMWLTLSIVHPYKSTPTRLILAERTQTA